MHFNNITRLYGSIYARLPCKPGKKVACLREGDYEAGHAITHVQTHVQSTVRVWSYRTRMVYKIVPYAYGTYHTRMVQNTIKLKYKAKRLADRTQDPVDISQYKMIKNNLKCQIRSAKLGYLHSLLVRARQVPQFAATLWSEVNNIIGRQVIRPSVIDPAVSLDSY